MNRIFALALLAVRLASCSPEDSQLLTDLQAYRWELTRLSVNGVDQDLDVILPGRVELNFEGARGYGRAGVNHYDLQFKFEDPNQISADEGDFTEMDGAPELIKLDEIYFKALLQVDTATVAGSTLILKSATERREYECHPPHPPGRSDPAQTDDHEPE